MFFSGISVVVPTIGRRTLINTIKSILDNLPLEVSAEIIVVSNVPLPDFLQDNPSLSDIIRIIEMPPSIKSAGRARNTGIKNARYPLVLLVDDDMQLATNCIGKMLEAMKAHYPAVISAFIDYAPEDMIFAQKTIIGKFIIKNGLTNSIGRYGAEVNCWDKTIVPVPSFGSNTLLVPLQVIENAGGYPEEITYAGYEDYIISKKVRQAGYPIYVVRDAISYHRELHKLEPRNFFRAFYTNAITRKQAVLLGYDELAICYSCIKKLIYGVVSIWQDPLIEIISKINNCPSLYPLLEPFVKLLVGYNIYTGYRTGKVTP